MFDESSLRPPLFPKELEAFHRGQAVEGVLSENGEEDERRGADPSRRGDGRQPCDWKAPRAPLRNYRETSKTPFDALPCILAPEATENCSPNTLDRQCMRCWTRKAPLVCLDCTKYYCGPCAAKAHSGSDDREGDGEGLGDEGPANRHRIVAAVRAGGIFQLPEQSALRRTMNKDETADCLEIRGSLHSLASENLRNAVFETRHFQASHPSSGLMRVGRRVLLCLYSSICCTEHTQEPAQYVCLDCKFALFCRLCFADGLHADHKISTTRAEVPAARMKLTNQFLQLKAQKQELNKVLTSLKALKVRAMKTLGTNQAQVRESFEAACAVLDEKREALEKEAAVSRGSVAAKIKEVETDCGRYRSYLEAKRQQLLLLGKLKKAAGLAVAVNAYTDLKPTVEAIDLNPETLTDMRQPLKLQPRQLKASELDDLLGEQQETLSLISTAINDFVSQTSEEVDALVNLRLNFDGPPPSAPREETLAEQRKAADSSSPTKPPLRRKSRRLEVDPFSAEFLQTPACTFACVFEMRCLLRAAPDHFQAFVRKDAIHCQWEVRMVSLRGFVLAVHQSTDDPTAAVESVIPLTSRVFANVFQSAQASSLAVSAQEAYAHGFEVVEIDPKTGELAGFALFASDGDALAREWVDLIEELCQQAAVFDSAGVSLSRGGGVDFPHCNPRASAEELGFERAAAALQFPAVFARRAAGLPSGIDEGGKDGGSGECTTAPRRSSSSVRDSNSGKSGSDSRTSDDSEDEDEESRSDSSSEGSIIDRGLARVRAPARPPVRRLSQVVSSTNEYAPPPGDLFRRRRERVDEAAARLEGAAVARPRRNTTKRQSREDPEDPDPSLRTQDSPAEASDASDASQESLDRRHPTARKALLQRSPSHALGPPESANSHREETTDSIPTVSSSPRSEEPRAVAETLSRNTPPLQTRLTLKKSGALVKAQAPSRPRSVSPVDAKVSVFVQKKTPQRPRAKVKAPSPPQSELTLRHSVGDSPSQHCLPAEKQSECSRVESPGVLSASLQRRFSYTAGMRSPQSRKHRSAVSSLGSGWQQTASREESEFTVVNLPLAAQMPVFEWNGPSEAASLSGEEESVHSSETPDSAHSKKSDSPTLSSQDALQDTRASQQEASNSQQRISDAKTEKAASFATEAEVSPEMVRAIMQRIGSLKLDGSNPTD